MKVEQNKKKILIVGTYPPPYGGIASIITNMLGTLKANGYSVTILSCGKKDEISYPQESVCVMRVELKRQLMLLLRPGNLWVTIKAALRFILSGLSLRETVQNLISLTIALKLEKEQGLDLVVAHHVEAGHFMGVLGRMRKDVRLVLSIYAELYIRRSMSERKKKAVLGLFKACDRIIATSQYCADGVANLGYDPKKVKVIYAGVDLAMFTPERKGADIRAKLKIGNDTRAILFVGRFLRQMGMDAVMGVIPDILNKYRDVVFLLVGARGELDGEARALREKYPEKVFVFNDVRFNELPDHYNAADFLVAPSQDKRACMGLAIKEAMACGRAVIATDSGGIPEAVIQDTGIIIPLRGIKADNAELIKAIEHLLNDPELCKKMGKAGRKRAEDLFTINSVNKKSLLLFDELIAGRTGKKND